MNELQHTPTPWAAWPTPKDRLGRYTVVCVNDEHCPGTGKEVVADKIRTEANARRIVACVNFLAPFATEQIEHGIDLVALIQQRDRLLEFAEEVRRTGDTRLASMAISTIAAARGAK